MAPNTKSTRRGRRTTRNEKGKGKDVMGTDPSGSNAPADSSPKKQDKGKGKATNYNPSANSFSPSTSSSSISSSSCTREIAPNQEANEKDTQATQGESEKGRTYTLFLEPRREEITQYAGGEFALGSMKYFFEHILPPVRPGLSIDRIMECCVKDKILRRNKRTKTYHWKCFPICRGARKIHESDVLGTPIEKLFDTITKAALKDAENEDLKATCYAHANGSRTTWSMKGSEITPDAHLFLNNPNDTYPRKYDGKHWYDAAFSFHFKRLTDSVFVEYQNAEHYDEYQNAEQILHNLHYCMSVDPCRRFTLGATIEGRRMRLWFYCRSIIICSVAFDFDAEPRTLIKVVLSLVFADKVDLGWDPTVTAKYIGGERVFDFDVAGKHFRTSSTNVVSDSRADGIYTSATRIYKAFTEDDAEEKMPVVIKDYWPTDRCETEDVIQRMILEDITDEEEREMVESMTLTPIASGRVRVGDGEDHTEKTILRGRGPINRYRIRLPNSNLKSASSSVTELEDCGDETDERIRELASQVIENRRIYNHRWHYRIVFKEYAVPYDKLRNLDDMLLVLVCAVKVLRVIHKAGWVHRDLSTGNLYLYTDPVTGEKRGLVGDLEFAKRVGTGKKSDDRLGTPGFMASEITNQIYHFDIEKESDVIQLPENFEDIDYNILRGSVASSSDEGVWANYIHDLESIWWIVVWTLIIYQDASMVTSKNKEYKEMRKMQRRFSRLLFSSCMNNSQRSLVVTSHTRFRILTNKIPDSLNELKTIACFVRGYLIEYYEKEESKGVDPIFLTDGGSLHDKILAVLNGVPRRNIIVESIEKAREKEVENSRSKRKASDNRDDIERPAKRLKAVQELKEVDTGSSMSSPGQVSQESETGADRMVLRSGLRCQPNKWNQGARARSRKTTGGARRPMMRGIAESAASNLGADCGQRADTKKAPLSSEVKGRQKNLNNKKRALVRGRKKSPKKLKEKELALDSNRRITRSMARKRPPVLETAAKHQATFPKSKVASSKSRKR